MLKEAAVVVVPAAVKPPTSLKLPLAIMFDCGVILAKDTSSRAKLQGEEAEKRMRSAYQQRGNEHVSIGGSAIFD